MSEIRVKNEDLDIYKNDKLAYLLNKKISKIMLHDLLFKIKVSLNKANLIVGKNVVLDVFLDDSSYGLSITLNDYIYSLEFRFNDDKLLNNCIIDNKSIGFIDYNTVNFKVYEFYENIDKKINVIKHEKAVNIYDKYKIR